MVYSVESINVLLIYLELGLGLGNSPRLARQTFSARKAVSLPRFTHDPEHMVPFGGMIKWGRTGNFALKY